MPNTEELIENSGVTRRQVYYWIERGVPLGERITGCPEGQGHKKVFTELEVEICKKILGPLADIMGGGPRKRGLPDSTYILTSVVNAIKEKPSILARTYIYISKSGQILTVPSDGWVLKLRKDTDER